MEVERSLLPLIVDERRGERCGRLIGRFAWLETFGQRRRRVGDAIEESFLLNQIGDLSLLLALLEPLLEVGLKLLLGHGRPLAELFILGLDDGTTTLDLRCVGAWGDARADALGETERFVACRDAVLGKGGVHLGWHGYGK